MHAPLYLTSHRLIYFLSKLMTGKILHETNQWRLLQRLQRQLRREEEGVIMDCSQSLFYFVWVITKQQNLSLATFSSSFQGSLVDSQWDHSKYYKVGANSIEIWVRAWSRMRSQWFQKGECKLWQLALSQNFSFQDMETIYAADVVLCGMRAAKSTQIWTDLRVFTLGWPIYPLYTIFLHHSLMAE